MHVRPAAVAPGVSGNPPNGAGSDLARGGDAIRQANSTGQSGKTPYTTNSGSHME